jgi:hypothetical protein
MDLRFTSRLLPGGKGSSSWSTISSPDGSNPSSGKGKPGKDTPPAYQIQFSRPPSDPEEAVASKKLKTAQEHLVREKTHTEKATRIFSAMSCDTSFNRFDAEQKKALTDEYFKNLLGSD